VAWDERYLLDNQQAEAGQRFDALSVLFNPSTFRHARAVGLGVGWRVWEVGAGSSSAPAWFAEQVGSEGHVLATDIDTSWLEDDDLGYEIRRHEVGLDPPPAGPFDLVHARLVLVHVPQRAQALAAIVAGDLPKGEVLATARIAGIQAAKRCSDLIPMCHPLSLTFVDITCVVDETVPGVRLESTVRCEARTGAEMEALAGAAVAALTVVDMAKSADRWMTIEGLELVEKQGGKSGALRRPD